LKSSLSLLPQSRPRLSPQRLSSNAQEQGTHEELIPASSLIALPYFTNRELDSPEHILQTPNFFKNKICRRSFVVGGVLEFLQGENAQRRLVPTFLHSPYTYFMLKVLLCFEQASCVL